MGNKIDWTSVFVTQYGMTKNLKPNILHGGKK